MKRSPRFLSRSLRGSLLPLTSLSFAFLLALRSRREDDRTGGKVAIHVIDLESVSSNELTQGSKVSRPRSPPHSHTAFASKTCAHAPARAPALTTDRALLCWRAASSFSQRIAVHSHCNTQFMQAYVSSYTIPKTTNLCHVSEYMDYSISDVVSYRFQKEKKGKKVTLLGIELCPSLSSASHTHTQS